MKYDLLEKNEKFSDGLAFDLNKIPTRGEERTCTWKKRISQVLEEGLLGLGGGFICRPSHLGRRRWDGAGFFGDRSQERLGPRSPLIQSH